MKRIMTLFIILALCMGSGAEEEFRVFTATDGRSIEARILEYNPTRNKLRIERRGKGTLWVAPEIFSVSDRKYIKEWVSASMFLSESNLRVSIKKVNVERLGSKKRLKERERVCYEIKVQNRSKQPLKVANAEYCYYVRNTKTGGGEDSEWTNTGELNIGALMPAQNKVLNTATISIVTMYRKHSEADAENNITHSVVKVSEDKIRGIWIRIYGPKVDGRSLYRDITDPKDLIEKVVWKKVPGAEEK